MKWLVVILIMGGLLYAGKTLMPASKAIDTTWMAPQIKPGMSQDEVRHTIGVDPTYVMKGGMGHDETWLYNDEYNAKVQLAIQFIDGRVYRSEKQTSP